MQPAIDDLEEQIRLAFRYRADQVPGTENFASEVARRHRPVRTATRLFVAAAVVVLAAGATMWIVASSSDDRVRVSTDGDGNACASSAGTATSSGAVDHYSIGSGIDGQPTPVQARCLAQEKQDYDPAEIAYLIAQANANDSGWVPDDQYLVSTLEFRRACRLTMRLANDTASADAESRATTVDSVMTPELERLVDRNPSDSQAAQMFGDLADQIKAGEHDRVVMWLNGSCPDALRWTRSP
jgi:hypothetical protein